MTKVEKVIKGLECCTLEKFGCPSPDCPYSYAKSDYRGDCIYGLCADALELLKEQEAQPAIIEGSDVIRIGRCPSCKTVLQPWGANYCYKCGQAVKWDD